MNNNGSNDYFAKDNNYRFITKNQKYGFPKVTDHIKKNSRRRK